MPLVKVEIIEGRSQEYKKAILNGIHKALVEAFKIPDDDRIQRLYELSSDNFELASFKSDKFVLIEMTVFAGRSIEAKRVLYSSIVKNLAEDPGIPGNDITIVLHEVPLDNWGIRGGKLGSETDLGFKINV
jgi:phenylpyruvate tautomerase PptA (4-oxalocrotonate tautomerase family)